MSEYREEENKAAAGGNGHVIARGWFLLAVTFGCLLLASWIIIRWDLDRSVAARFYSDTGGWRLAKRQPWLWLYQYGTIPGLVLAAGSLIAWAVCVAKRRHHLQRYFLVIVLTAVIGPGILVNGVLKNYWGRPRPRQVLEFGGQWEYRHLNRPGIPGKGESFTCGHCTMGFIFLSLLVFRRNKAWVAAAGGGAGLALGGLLGAARVVQGAHFLSDVIWSLGIVLMVLTSLYFLVLRVPKIRSGPHRRWPAPVRYAGICLLCASAAAMLLWLLMERPFYKEEITALDLPPDLTRITVETPDDIERFNVQYRDGHESGIVFAARGFGWINAEHRLRKSLEYRSRQLIVRLAAEPRGHFTELTHEITVFLPPALENRVRVELSGG